MQLKRLPEAVEHLLGRHAPKIRVGRVVKLTLVRDLVVEQEHRRRLRGLVARGLRRRVLVAQLRKVERARGAGAAQRARGLVERARRLHLVLPGVVPEHDARAGRVADRRLPQVLLVRPINATEFRLAVARAPRAGHRRRAVPLQRPPVDVEPFLLLRVLALLLRGDVDRLRAVRVLAPRPARAAGQRRVERRLQCGGDRFLIRGQHAVERAKRREQRRARPVAPQQRRVGPHGAAHRGLGRQRGRHERSVSFQLLLQRFGRQLVGHRQAALPLEVRVDAAVPLAEVPVAPVDHDRARQRGGLLLLRRRRAVLVRRADEEVQVQADAFGVIFLGAHDLPGFPEAFLGRLRRGVERLWLLHAEATVPAHVLSTRWNEAHTTRSVTDGRLVGRSLERLRLLLHAQAAPHAQMLWRGATHGADHSRIMYHGGGPDDGRNDFRCG